MIPYYFFFGFLFIISLFDLIKKDIKFKEIIESFIFRLLWVILIFFIGFRYKMANDWIAYDAYIHQIESLKEVLFGDAPNFHFYNNIEYGFKLLMSFINLLFDPEGGSLQALTATVSIFCYSVLINFTRKDSSIPYKFIFLSVFISLTMFWEFDILRQSIALYIFLFSIKYSNNNFLKYALINIFGSFFHISAIIFIPLYFIYRIKFSRISIVIILVLYIFSMVTHFSFVTALINLLSNYFPELIFLQKLYATTTLVETPNSFSLVGLIYSAFLMLLFLKYHKIDFANNKIRLFINMFFIFIIINILFSDSKEVADRLSYYFNIGLAFLFVYSIQFIPKIIIFPYMALIMAFPVIRFFRVMANPITSIVNVPYRNYFFAKPEDEEDILINRLEKN